MNLTLRKAPNSRRKEWPFTFVFWAIILDSKLLSGFKINKRSILTRAGPPKSLSSTPLELIGELYTIPPLAGSRLRLLKLDLTSRFLYFLLEGFGFFFLHAFLYH